MSGGANAARGEAAILVGGAPLKLRPSFAALVAAEEELGSLFALVERAGESGLTLRETAALLWHCADPPPEGLTRARIGDAVAELGLAGTAPVLRVLLRQIVQGSGAGPG
jgi:hypothetical protein